MEEKKGIVFDIKKAAMHDGPGVRTLVCMKGCPLRCLWCSTPESQKPYPEVFILETNCKGCGRCIERCPHGAIRPLEEKGVAIDRTLCDHCGQCVDACEFGGLQMKGIRMTVGELYREIDKDSIAYRRGRGGVTIGGGELTMQHDFVSDVLETCRKHFIHTAIETCGYTPWEHMEQILRHVKLLYLDIKHMNNDAHKKVTRVSNKRILENARKAARQCKMIIRVPVVPGINDSEENIASTAKFAAELGQNIIEIELLRYHPWGVPSFERLGMEYSLKNVEAPGESQMQGLKEICESHGLKAKIGG